MIRYHIYLSAEERAELKRKVNRGKGKAREIQKAHVLLASDEETERQSETALSRAYHLSVRSVERIRRRFCESGMGIFEPQPRKVRCDKKIDGTVEAHILAVSCSEPPAGQSRWKLQTIADKLIELGVIAHLSHTSAGIVLKKMRSGPGG